MAVDPGWPPGGLAAGDHRLLYLSWLGGVQAGFVDDEAVEPTCPSGLDDLSPTLQSFVDFAWLDPDLLAAAVEGSPPLRPASDRDLEQWIRGISDKEKTGLLLRVARSDNSVAIELSNL